MKVAIFADIHGKILLPFRLVNLYQKETNEKIDFILQCGDMGCYPAIDNLDKATIKHAKNDRDELGFHDYFVKDIPKIRIFLNQLNINMICVRGNHEDHDYLDKLERETNESIFPVDIYNRVFVCKTGYKQELKAGNETLSFVGVGRIGDRKERTNSRFIQEYEKKKIKKLIKENKDIVDLLITHDKDDSSQRGYGMKEISNLLDNIIFKYHFYGHTGEPYHEQMHTNGITKSIKIKEAEFNRSGILEQGSMVVLEKTNAEITTKIVEQRLTNQLTKFNWHI
ncbi:MAG: metallophosphoesterase [Thermonemataceae bacterium]